MTSTEEDLAVRPIIAFYHDPPIWVKSMPIDMDALPTPDLNRLRSIVFRGSIAGLIDVAATAEGVFAFDFSRWHTVAPKAPLEPNLLKFDQRAAVILGRIVVMNSFLAFLYTSELRISRFAGAWMLITPDDISSANDLESDITATTVKSRDLSLASFASTYRPDLPIRFDQRMVFRNRLMSDEVVQSAIDSLSEVIQRLGSDDLLLTDLYLRAMKSYSEHNYSTSLVLSWSITERMLQLTWRGYLESNRQRDEKPFINSNRMDRLNDFAVYTAAVQSEIMSLTDQIPLDLYKKMVVVRNLRNKWLHGFRTTISRDEANNALAVCEEMMRLARGIDVEMAKNLTLHW